MKSGHAARFDDEELAGTVVERSVAFMEAHQKLPFFLYAGVFEPHVPRVADSPFVGKIGCGVRGDVIEQIDWETSELMAALNRLHLATNTLVLFKMKLNGAGEGNRTLVCSLEDCRSTIELRPQPCKS